MRYQLCSKVFSQRCTQLSIHTHTCIYEIDPVKTAVNRQGWVGGVRAAGVVAFSARAEGIRGAWPQLTCNKKCAFFYIYEHITQLVIIVRHSP